MVGHTHLVEPACVINWNMGVFAVPSILCTKTQRLFITDFALSVVKIKFRA